MKPSEVADIDGDVFPDPLSVSYNNTKLTVIPSAHTVTAGDIAKFWLYMYRRYGVCEMDDVLLSLNGIPYIGMLAPGDEIAEIEATDLNKFTTQLLDS